MRQIHNLREHLKGVAASIDAAGHGRKGDLVAHHAEDLGLSVQALYRTLKNEIGWESGRKTRADKGSTCVPESSLEFMAALQRATPRKNGKQILHAPMARFITEQSGMQISVTPSRAQALLRQRGLDAATQARPLPHVEMRSRPNQCHQVDPSLCLIYYSPNGEQNVIREDQVYKNKFEAFDKVKLKVWRYVLVDHASHWICVRYYEARGETQDSLFKFLMHAWTKRDDCPFHGVPASLMMDPGSANTAHAISNLVDALEVKLLINKPGQPRAKGGVEVAQNIVEDHFESMLRLQPVNSVAELNEAVDRWCIAYNGNQIKGLITTLHRVGIKPTARTDLWLKIRPEELRQCPSFAVCAMLMRGAQRELQVSNGLSIRYRHPQSPATRTYDVRNIRTLRAGEKVTVRPLVYGDEAVIIEVTRYDGEKQTSRLEPVRDYDEFGRRADAPLIGEEYHSLPVHAAQEQSEQLDAIAFGVDGDGVIRDREQIEKAKGDSKAHPFANMNGGLGLKPLDALKSITPLTYLPKKATPIEIKSAPLKPLQSVELEKTGGALCVPSAAQLSDDDTRLSHLQMAKRLRVELEEHWNSDLYAEMAAAYPQGVTYEEMPSVIERFKRTTGLAGLRVVK
ncbi:MAG TPA: hypothetical protein VF928_09365 [Usitatibacteraceae bacterium]